MKSILELLLNATPCGSAAASWAVNEKRSFLQLEEFALKVYLSPSSLKQRAHNKLSDCAPA